MWAEWTRKLTQTVRLDVLLQCINCLSIWNFKTPRTCQVVMDKRPTLFIIARPQKSPSSWNPTHLLFLGQIRKYLWNSSRIRIHRPVAWLRGGCTEVTCNLVLPDSAWHITQGKNYTTLPRAVSRSVIFKYLFYNVRFLLQQNNYTYFPLLINLWPIEW